MSDPRPLLVSAHESYIRGDLDEAQQLTAALLISHPQYADAFHLMGLIRWRRNDRAGAIESMRKASSLEPLHPRYHYNLGTMFQDIGNSADAIAELSEALKLDPENLSAANNLAALLSRAGQLTESEMLCRKYHQP